MEEVIELRLTNTDEVALIDASDYEKVKGIKWFKNSNGYVAKSLYVGNGKWEGLKLHRMIMDAPKGVLVDHINRNRLDNRRSNLRLATPLENTRNTSLAKNNTTGYKGVSERKGKYEAHIRIDGVLQHLGNYDNKEDAAKAYNVMAEKHFGEFAALNDVEHAGFQLKKKPAPYSRYRGVSFHKHKRKWYAALYTDGKMYHIGCYKTEIEAAEAYNEFAIKMLGDKAKLNVINEEEPA